MPSSAAQDFAAYQLCRNQTAAQLADLIRAPDSNKATRLAAVRALQQFDYAAIRPVVADLLASPRASHRAAAAAALGQMQTALNANERDEIAATLIALWRHDARAGVRADCLASVGHLFRRGTFARAEFTRCGFAQALRPLWHSPHPTIANALAFAAAYIPLNSVVQRFLLRRLASADNTTASWALFAIAEQNWRCGKINRLLRQRMAGLHPQSAFYEEILAYLNDDKAA